MSDQNLLLPHQKDALEWAIQKAPTSHIVGNGSNLTGDLPQLIDDVKRAYKGFRVFSEGRWKYYAADCMTEEQVQRFEWLLDEYGPGKVRN